MTYREGKVYLYDRLTLDPIKTFKMPPEMEEGWGLTHNDEHIFASDGTDRLFKINPENFTVIQTIPVTDKNGKPVRFINELELVGDYIYANILPLNVIAKIDINTGKIVNVWDMKELYNQQMALVKKTNR